MTLSATPQARRRAGARWRALQERLQSVSPQALARGIIAAAVIGLGVALAVGTWPTLLPFVVGAMIAYAVLPIANRLDRFMPRFLAAILAELVALGIIVGVLVLVVPPLLSGLVRVALELPTGAQVQTWLADLEGQLGPLPDPLGGILLAVATEASTNLQGTLNGFVQGAGAFVTSQILGIFGTASFLLGLLVIPAWVLTIVSDERSIKRHGATCSPRPSAGTRTRSSGSSTGPWARSSGCGCSSAWWSRSWSGPASRSPRPSGSGPSRTP